MKKIQNEAILKSIKWLFLPTIVLFLIVLCATLSLSNTIDIFIKPENIGIRLAIVLTELVVFLILVFVNIYKLKKKQVISEFGDIDKDSFGNVEIEYFYNSYDSMNLKINGQSKIFNNVKELGFNEFSKCFICLSEDEKEIYIKITKK
jgi:hypothetical protein